ncbi:DNA transposase [Fusarium oxysporum f. sp. phaseoli]
MVSQIHHSPHKRTKIYWLHKSGRSAVDISQELGMSRHAIYGIIRRYPAQQSAQDQPRSGRPTAIGPRELRRIKIIIARDPHIQLQDLLQQAQLTCHKDTLIRHLKKAGIMHCQSILRPFLSNEAAAQRLQFARLYVNKPIEFWKKWNFSDEVIVARGEGQRRSWVFIEGKERLRRENIQTRITPTRHSQMFFSAFNYYRKLPLVPLDGDPEAERSGVTARVLLEAFEQHLHRLVTRNTVFQHDNSSLFRSHLIGSWLPIFLRNQHAMSTWWPAYSPDLNPIENLWHILKERICNKYPELAYFPRNQETLEALFNAATEVWEEIKPEVLENLILSINRRLQAVIDNDGWYTKY